MIDPRRGPTRVVRASALAGAATAVGALAHGWAAGDDGMPPSVLLTLALVSLVITVPLTARRLQTGPVTAFLFLDQIAVHVALSGHHTAGSVSGSGHAGHAGLAAPLPPVEHTLSWSMLGAHLAVALLVGLVWARGEAWLWRLASWLRVPTPRSPSTIAHLPAPVLLVLLHPFDVLDLAPARGPPVRSLPTT